MSRLATKTAYRTHLHNFPFEERKNGSVVIHPCDLCGQVPRTELQAQSWDVVEGPNEEKAS